jgi:hypothetical protein
MIVPRTPDARSPGPRGPDEFSPTGGSCRRAALAAADIRSSCRQISSLTASGRSGAASPAALAAYAAAPRACAHMRDACGLSGRSGGGHRCGSAHLTRGGMSDETAAGLSDAELATSKGPQPNDRITGRLSPGASASNSPSTRSTQSAAHTATIHRSARSVSAENPHPDLPRRFGARALHAADRPPTPSSASRSSAREVASRRGRGSLNAS